jgi:hypothetical protein
LLVEATEDARRQMPSRNLQLKELLSRRRGRVGEKEIAVPVKLVGQQPKVRKHGVGSF